MFKAKILSGCWNESTLEVTGMPKDFILSARTLVVLELDEYDHLKVSEKLLEQFLANQDSYCDACKKTAKANLLEEAVPLLRNCEAGLKYFLGNFAKDAIDRQATSENIREVNTFLAKAKALLPR